MNQEIIPWSELSPDAVEFFDALQIERLDATIQFHKDLRRTELATAICRLWDFQQRLPEHQESIAQAICDALNEFVRLFGTDDGQYFVSQFEAILQLRDTIHKMIGETLVGIQHVENKIKLCCALLNLKVSISDFFSDKCALTLGQLKTELSKARIPFPDFDHQLKQFIRDRNSFVHTLWVCDGKIDSRLGMFNSDYYENKYDFIISVMDQAQRIDRVFKGLIYKFCNSIGDEHIKSAITIWAQYMNDADLSLRININPPPDSTSNKKADR